MNLKLLPEVMRVRLNLEEARSLADGKSIFQAFPLPGDRHIEVLIQGREEYRESWDSSNRVLTLEIPRLDLMAMLETDDRKGLLKTYGKAAGEIDLWSVREGRKNSRGGEK